MLRHHALKLRYGPLFPPRQKLLSFISNHWRQIYSRISDSSSYLCATSRPSSSPPRSVPNTTIPSGSILTYSIDSRSGELGLVDAAPVGGSSPRQFSVNAAGNPVAVAVQTISGSGGLYVGVPAFEDAQFGVQGPNESVRSRKKSGRRVLVLA